MTMRIANHKSLLVLLFIIASWITFAVIQNSTKVGIAFFFVFHKTIFLRDTSLVLEKSKQADL